MWKSTSVVRCSKFPYIHKLVSGLSMLFHWFSCQFPRQYHTINDHSFISNLQYYFGYSCLWFSMNLMLILFDFKGKNPTAIFIWIKSEFINYFVENWHLYDTESSHPQKRYIFLSFYKALSSFVDLVKCIPKLLPFLVIINGIDFNYSTNGLLLV